MKRCFPNQRSWRKKLAPRSQNKVLLSNREAKPVLFITLDRKTELSARAPARLCSSALALRWSPITHTLSPRYFTLRQQSEIFRQSSMLLWNLWTVLSQTIYDITVTLTPLLVTSEMVYPDACMLASRPVFNIIAIKWINTVILCFELKRRKKERHSGKCCLTQECERLKMTFQDLWYSSFQGCSLGTGNWVSPKGVKILQIKDLICLSISRSWFNSTFWFRHFFFQHWSPVLLWICDRNWKLILILDLKSWCPYFNLTMKHSAGLCLFVLMKELSETDFTHSARDTKSVF